MSSRSLKDIADDCHLVAKNHGFWEDPRNIGEALMLIVSEASEALEAHRSKEQRMDEHCTEFKSFDVELADIVIRVFDLACGTGIDISAVVEAKLNFNRSRPIKHGKRY